MSERDQWQSDQRVSQAKEIIEKKNKKLTKAERKKQAEKFEQQEKERLAAAANEKLANGTPPELQAVGVENGPLCKGLSGFGMFRRQQKQKSENARREKELHRLKKLAGKNVERNESMASSTGSVKPLSSVLTKQLKKSKRSKAQSEVPGLGDDELREELDNIGVMLDIASNDQASSSGEAAKSSSKDKSKVKTLDDSVFAKPAIPRGYVKADTLKLMKEMYLQQSQLITSNQKQFSEIQAQVKVIIFCFVF